MAKIESGQRRVAHRRRRHARRDRARGPQPPELFRERGAAVELDLPDRVPPLRADPDRLTQVMLNLLSNAAKFVPGEGGRVEVALRDGRATWCVEVRDNGPGVPAAERATVFEKFRQGGDALTRPQGTGLGLPISRQIVEHFGGRMWLNRARAGRCFAFACRCGREETTRSTRC